MNIKSLKIFCDIVTQRSFSRAASDNGISQSGASQVVSQLEGRLGVQLIERSKRPLVLTREGKVFYDELNDSPNYPRSYGLAGWTKNDKKILIYDRYDIWEFNPDDATSRRLTKGRETKTSFRYDIKITRKRKKGI